MLVVMGVGCTYNDETSNWILHSYKPVAVHSAGENELGQHSYTLIDAKCNVYYTRLVDLILPDTLK